MKLKEFDCFDTFVLRTPLFPINFYTDLIRNYSSKNLFDLLNSNLVRVAIHLASPELISELDKFLTNLTATHPEKKMKLELALLKYIARLSSRATPFGIFAGCTTGKIAASTQIQIKDKEFHEVCTQFDMHYWISLLQDIAKNKDVQKHLNYYCNTSLYKIADFYRYVEYQYINKKREHVLSSIRANSILDLLIENSKNGLSFKELVNLIIDNESEKEEASEFLLELIDNQILVSELDATITGNLEVKRIIKILETIPNFISEYHILKEMDLLLEKNVTSIDAEQQFDKLKNLVGKLNTEYEEKFLLQSDLYLKTTSATLSKKVSVKIQNALCFLSKIRRNKENPNLASFKNAFLKRYETREMPLSVVLDAELGIGYLQHTKMNDVHSILDHFSFNTNQTIGSNTEEWSQVDYVLEKKLKETVSNNTDILCLQEKDFNFLENEKVVIPDTFSVMAELFYGEEKELIAIESCSNYSASKLIGRFCNGDQEIFNLANKIVLKESELNPNKILAEIVHIPQDRTGNVLRRPSLRSYEIPYLANSILPSSQQINLEDLHVSIKNNQVILKSKLLKKEIIPCLSNAHNFSYNSLPIYHFLCDLQGQNVCPIPSFIWGVLENHYSYFPRVVYEDVILAKAKWFVKYEELEVFLSKSDSKFDYSAFKIWKESKKIPQYVNFVEGDNTLLLDLKEEIGIKLFLKTIKPYKKITLEEFLFLDNSIVKDKACNSFANQFVLSYYKLNNYE